MNSDHISLARGVPSYELLPWRELNGVWSTALETGPLLYGSPRGVQSLRRWVARRAHVGEERVILTNGSLHALHLILELLVSSGQTVIAEQPAYDYAIAALRRSRGRLEGIDADSDGLIVEALTDRLNRGPRPVAVYVNPTFQNPSGVSLSRERRAALVALACAHDVMIIEDDPYSDLSLGPPSSSGAMPSLLDLDARGSNVVRLVSFSKIVAPGLRCGAAIVPDELAVSLERLCSQLYISPGNAAHAVVGAFCESPGFDVHLARLRSSLWERRDALAGALTDHVGDRAQWRLPSGGFFFWLRLVDRSAAEVADAAAAHGLDVVPGGGFFLDGRGTDHLRLTFAGEPPQRMPEAARRLAAALNAI